jgi:pilus assembly protein CpaF
MSSSSPEPDRNPIPGKPFVIGSPNGIGKSGTSVLKQRLLQHLKTTLAAQRDKRLSEENLRVELTRLSENALDDEGHSLDYAGGQKVVGEALSEVFSYGPIEGLLRDQAITDIFINGPHQVYFDKGGQLQATDVAFRDKEQLEQVIRRMLAGSGRPLDEKRRMVDARLPDGSRLNVILSPPALNGPLVSIRRFGARPLAASDLVANESMTSEMLDFLAACVKCRLNMVVSGGSGTGKTTLLNALSRFIPDSERVMTIEDTAELELQQRHVAKMEATVESSEGDEAVSMRDLVRNALRMRPDRIIVGECRGAEVLDMLQAMNTGHEGSMTTVHANAPREALARIELMAALEGSQIPGHVVRRLAATSVNILVQLARQTGGRRKVVAISEITGMEGETVSLHSVFEYVQTGIDPVQGGVGHFRATGVRPKCLDKLRVRGANISPQLFIERVLHMQNSNGLRR